MKKRNIYLNKYQQKSPKPLTPADEAWQKMGALLDTEMPASNQKSKKRAFAIGFSQLAISLVAAIILVGGGTYITLKTIEKKEIHATKHSVKQPKLNRLINNAIQTKDSTLLGDIEYQTINETNQKVNVENIPQQQNNQNKISAQTFIPILNNSQKVLSNKKPNLNKVLVDSKNSKSKKMTSYKNPIELQTKTTHVDTVTLDNSRLNTVLPQDENIAKVTLKNKTNLIDSLEADKNSTNMKLSTKEGKKNENKVSLDPKNNHLFIGLSGNNGLLFAKNASKSIYLYGEILTIGVRNIKYNLTIETGIGFQALEYHVPYSRTLDTYQATGVYDSTITVSSYKYSRYNVVIPLYITKEIFHFNCIFLDVKTGITTSIFLSKQRLFSQLPIDIQLIESSNSASNINLSFALSPQFRWDINNKFSLNFNPSGVIYLNSLYQNYSLKPIGINLTAGIHYIF